MLHSFVAVDSLRRAGLDFALGFLTVFSHWTVLAPASWHWQQPGRSEELVVRGQRTVLCLAARSNFHRPDNLGALAENATVVTASSLIVNHRGDIDHA